MTNADELDTIKRSIRLSNIVSQTITLKKQNPEEFLGLCPFHSESTPSFRVYDSTGRYFCFGCQAKGDVFEWLETQRGMKLPEAKKFLGAGNAAPIEEKSQKASISPYPTNDDSFEFRVGYSTIHYYKNEHGGLLYKIARYEASTDKRKFFLPATHTTNGWIDKAPTEGRIIYNLERLTNSTGIVILVAGEKKCDQLQALLPNNAVISWMGGDSAFDKTDWRPIEQRKVIFWPDNDDVSKKVQHQIKCEKLWVSAIPADMPKGWDCGDAVAAGWTYNDVMALFNDKALYEAPKDIKEAASKITYQLPGKLHGLCGDIESWINDTAYKKQPLLAINAALVFVGALKGQRVCTERNLLTNMYALSLGESGCGKDHPRQCLEVLANAVGLQDKMMSGVPASGTALVKSVKRGGRCLIQIDELGRVIGNINGKNAGGFQREIIDNMMMLYSSASTLFREKEYAAGREDKEKNAIIKPCLCIHAMTVPERFYNNLTTDDVIDGFLSRWMIVASDNPDPDESEVDIDIEDIPQSIIDRVNAIQDMPVNTKVAELPVTEQQIEKIQNAINPKVIPLTAEAKAILSQYKDVARKLKNDLRVAGSPLNALWVRMGENAHKIALIIQEGDYITKEDMQWACDWVMYWTQYSIDQVKEKLSENEYDKRMKHLLGVIRKRTDGISKSELINYTKYGKKIREELLAELEEGGFIEQKDGEYKTKKVKLYFAC